MSFDTQQLARRVASAVESWTPARAYDREPDFSNDLKTHLDTTLNEGRGLGPQRHHVVEREHGRSNGDVAVDDVIGIELKRNLTNGNINTLRGQIEKYRDEYEYAIVCACGIEDMDGWRRLQNEYADDPMAGLDQQAPVKFIHTPRSEYGDTVAGGVSIPDSATALQREILEAYAADPDRSVPALASRCDCSESYVRSTLSDYEAVTKAADQSQTRGRASTTDQPAGEGAEAIAEAVATGIKGAKTLRGADTGMSTETAAVAVVRMVLVVTILGALVVYAATLF